MNDFLNSLFQKTKQVADLATKKTGEVVEVSKLKIEAMKTESSIKGMYEKLGIAVYSMIQEDYQDNELLVTLSEEIDDLYDQLDDITRQIDFYRNAVECPNCRAKNDMENSFCSKCGTQLPNEDCGCGCCCDSAEDKCDCTDEKCDCCTDESCDCECHTEKVDCCGEEGCGCNAEEVKSDCCGEQGCGCNTEEAKSDCCNEEPKTDCCGEEGCGCEGEKQGE